MAEEIFYEYKIAYSRSIAADVIFGGFLLVGGIAFAVLVKLWLALLAAFAGLFMIWKAIKRNYTKGPQLIIGQAGIWTAATGHLSWAQALPTYKIRASRNRATTYLVILHRQSLHTELARFDPEDLDVDSCSLKAYLNEFAPEKVETLV